MMSQVLVRPIEIADFLFYLLKLALGNRMIEGLVGFSRQTFLLGNYERVQMWPAVLFAFALDCC